MTMTMTMKMKTIILLQIIFVLQIVNLSNGFLKFTTGGGLSAELNDHWDNFKLTYKKEYDSQFEFVRRLIWESNVKYIQRHNLEYDMGLHTYALGVNKFTDLTLEEFRAHYLGLKPKPKNHNFTSSRYMSPLNAGVLPDLVDWRDKGLVTPVKNQGQCGSCWSFSTTGSLEGQFYRKTNNLMSFSEQQLVDCSTSYNNSGCDGGLMDNAFKYIQDYGIMKEDDYPYRAQQGKCRYDKEKVETRITGLVDIPQEDELALQDAVANVGPISIAVDASHQSFQLYKHGVYNEKKCSTEELDHALLAVGYGTEDGIPYWLVKNSWGSEWGMNGYIKMSRNNKNQCGIATMASYPLL